MTTSEALTAVMAARLDSVEIHLANRNPHWWFGFSPVLGLWWSYECCEGCDQNEFEDHLTPESLKENLQHQDDCGWVDVT